LWVRMKNSYLVLILVLLTLVLVYFGSELRSRQREQVVLEAQILDVTQVLSQVSDIDLAGLERQLAEARADLSAERMVLPPPGNTTPVVDLLLREAAEHSVVAIPLATQEWRQERLGEQEVSVFRLSVEASGTYGAVLAYLNALESSRLSNLMLEDVTLYVLDNTPDGDDILVTAELSLAVYAGPPAAE